MKDKLIGALIGLAVAAVLFASLGLAQAAPWQAEPKGWKHQYSGNLTAVDVSEAIGVPAELITVVKSGDEITIYINTDTDLTSSQQAALDALLGKVGKGLRRVK